MTAYESACYPMISGTAGSPSVSGGRERLIDDPSARGMEAGWSGAKSYGRA